MARFKTFKVTGIAYDATMVVKNGKYIVKAGSLINPINHESLKFSRKTYVKRASAMKNNCNYTRAKGYYLTEDVALDSLSGAGAFISGALINPKAFWKLSA